MPPKPRQSPSDWLVGGGEMGALIRSTDWLRSPLGPRERWPLSLQTVVSLVIESPLPTALLWGRERLLLYNDAFRAIAGDNHPRAVGRCDPEAATWRVPMERNRPQYPGVLQMGREVPMDPDGAGTLRLLLASDGPVKFGPGTPHPLPKDVSESFGFKCYMSMAVHPKVGKPWQFGIHQCSYARLWTHEEERLLQEIGRRLADGLTTLLAYRELKDSQLKLREAQRIAHVGYWDRDVAANRIELAEEACRILGLPSETSALCLNEWDERWLSIVHPEDRARAAEALAEALRGGAPYRIDYRVVRSSGEVRYVHSEADIVRDAAGRPCRALGMIQDITERNRAEAALRELNDRLVEADRRKNEFLAVLSHELRNPLAPIRNSIYILDRAAPGGEQARRAQHIIDRQVQHMTRLVEDLLDITRISRGKVTLRRERVDLNALVRGAAEDHREIFSRSGIGLEVIEARQPLWVDADPTRLAQVIGNLLSNSAKFTPRGGTTVLSVEPNVRRQAVIRVHDNGAGIPPEIHASLFEPFAQAAQTLERSRGGLGLSLALVKGLVEMHGGEVAAHSEGEGKGAEFTIALPLLPSARPKLAQMPASKSSSRGRKVLVVEDNVDAAESLREALELADHKVAVAYSGPEGVEVARSYRPEVILCDLGLPGMDGFSVARALRADRDAVLRSAYLVALSGYALTEDVARSKEAGFDHHVAKPPKIEELQEVLAQAPARAATSY